MSGKNSDNGSNITLIDEEQLKYLKQTDPKLYKKLKESLNGGLRKFKSKGGIEGKDYIKCKICGRYSYDSIIHHLRILHNVTREQYNEEFPDSLTVPQNIRDRMKGSNNPGYQHGGRLSPWSNKSEKHSKEQIEEAKRKAKLDRPNVRLLSYWESKGLSKEEAKEALGKFQTRDLDFFINKYGEELGTEKWNNKINTWQKTLNSKSDKEKQEINKKKSCMINYQTLWGGNLDSPGNFYIIKLTENCFKIGITSKSKITKRYKPKLLESVDVLLFEQMKDINHAFQTEQLLKYKFKDKIFQGNYGKCFGWVEVINDITEEELRSELNLYLKDHKYTNDNFNIKFKKN